MEYLTTEQAAEIAHCSIFRIREAVKAGELAAYKPAKGYLFTRESLDKWIRVSAVKKEG